MSTETHRLYRSRSERMIGGVAGGLGEYLGVDPTIIRLLFVLSLFLFPGPGAVIVYLILLLVVPEEPVATTSPDVIVHADTPSESTPVAETVTGETSTE